MSHHPDRGSAAASPPHEEGSIHGAESLSCQPPWAARKGRGDVEGVAGAAVAAKSLPPLPRLCLRQVYKYPYGGGGIRLHCANVIPNGSIAEADGRLRHCFSPPEQTRKLLG